jgi:RND family efflux transporter MFP subunit
MKPLAPLVAVMAVLAAAGCGAGKESGPAAPSAAVTTVAALARDIRGSVAGYGVIEFAPAGSESLVVQVESQVTAVLAASGTRVRRGDGLLRLRPSATTQLDVDRAAREATQAATEARRLGRLREEGLATDAEAEAAKSAAATAGQLRDSLVARTGGGREYVLKATRDGIVDGLTVQPGDLLAPGATAARLGDPGNLQARIGLEPDDGQRVAPGAMATVTVLGGTGAAVTGQVRAVEQRIDPESRLTAALVNLPPTPGLVPGAPVGGRIVVATHAGAIVVPRTAVLRDGAATSVFVVDGGKARRRAVHAGLDEGELVKIIDGLRAGERVITTGNHEVDDGMAVRELPSPVPAVRDSP